MFFDSTPSQFLYSNSSFHQKPNNFPAPPGYSSKEGPKSKAYLNAMKSLQEKIKELEKEKVAWATEKQEIISTVEVEYQEIMSQYKKEIDEYLTKEFDFKEKIQLLEKKLAETQHFVEETEEKHAKMQEEQEKRLLNANRELFDTKALLQEEIQRSESFRNEFRNLNEKNHVLSEENARLVQESREDREKLQEKIQEIESKYQESLLELQEVKEHYSSEINEYQEELIRIQGKFQLEMESLLKEKDQLIVENRRLSNENSLKEEDLTILKRKIENLLFEKKKDDMYKQITNEFQGNRDSAGSFFRLPTEYSSNLRVFQGGFNENHEAFNKKNEKRKSNLQIDSSDDEKNKKKTKKNVKHKKLDENSSISSKEDEDQENDRDFSIKNNYYSNDSFINTNNLSNSQDFERNFKEILTLEQEIKQTNEKYESLVLESQASVDSQEKAKIRQKLFVLNETLNKANEKLLYLRKKMPKTNKN